MFFSDTAWFPGDSSAPALLRLTLPLRSFAQLELRIFRSMHVSEDSADLALMMSIVSLTVDNLLTNDLGFFFFFGGVFL